jgi:hypothetical protein
MCTKKTGREAVPAGLLALCEADQFIGKVALRRPLMGHTQFREWIEGVPVSRRCRDSLQPGRRVAATIESISS